MRKFVLHGKIEVLLFKGSDLMLQFVLGRSGSGKTEYLRKILVDLSGVSNGGLMMIVPEQYSFETEKAILRLAGAKRANKIYVVSFSRLADLIFRTEGGTAGNRLTDGGRRIMMNLALRNCADSLKAYKDSVKKGNLTDIMLTAVHEMKLCSISGDDLRDTAQKVEETGLKDKLYDISLLYDTYNALVAQTHLDSRDDLTRLAQKLEISSFFNDFTVAIDSFEGFTLQEMQVLVPIMQKSQNVIISLCADKNQTENSDIFALTHRTRSRLFQLAQENYVKVSPDIILNETVRFKSDSMKNLEANFLSSYKSSSFKNHDGIHLFCAKDIFEEADYTAACIRNLVMSKNLRYSDFTVICRTPEVYANTLETAFKKRDIPCFISHPQNASAEPVMRFVLCAFEAIMHSMNPDDIFDMLKTGVSGFSAEEISDIENYSFLWQLKGKDWHHEFTKHPKGFGYELKPSDVETLDYLNSLRKKIITPLEVFSKSTSHANGDEISQAIYKMLSSYDMEKSILSYCKTLENADFKTLSEKQIRIWNLLIEILEQMSTILGKHLISCENYYQLLNDVINGEDVSEIPQVLDSVLFGMPEQIRQSSPKIVFLLGCTQGDFPLIPKNSGVFSDNERQTLIELELPLGDPLPQKMIEERYLAYSSAVLASEELYVSFPAFGGGQEKQPSEIISSIQDIFTGISFENYDKILFFANTKESAFTVMAEKFAENSPQSSALKQFFKNDSHFEGRLFALERAADKSPAKIQDKRLAEKAFSKITKLSPTQIETFYKCKFRYFCRYALSAKERRTAEFDAMQYGNIMHFIFENIFSDKSINAAEIPEDELCALISSLIDRFVQINMGSVDNLSKREQYRLKRMVKSVEVLIRHVATELAQSRFIPQGFEVKIGEDFPPLKISTKNGHAVYVGGTIDRMDIYESPRGNFVRIIDYKTGAKDFAFSDVLYGMNIQMLVYLAALVQNGNLLPAGVLYTPLAMPTISAEKNTPTDDIEDKKRKKLKMQGLILEDYEIIDAMEQTGAGNYIPAKLDKNGIKKSNFTLNDMQFNAVLDYSSSLIASMTDTLFDGNVEADPLKTNSLGCNFCPYKSVCGKEYTDKDSKKSDLDKNEVISLMTQEKEDLSGKDELDT